MLVKRLALGVLTLILLSLLIFLSVEALPGDLAEAILGQQATPENTAAIRRELGLDLPPWTRYLHWLGGVLQGDFGNSLALRKPIAELIAPRLANTLFLTLYTACIAVPIALILGMAASLFRNSYFDRISNITALSAISMPEFFVGYVMIYFFAISGYFPINGEHQCRDAFFRKTLSMFPARIDANPSRHRPHDAYDARGDYQCSSPALY